MKNLMSPQQPQISKKEQKVHTAAQNMRCSTAMECAVYQKNMLGKFSRFVTRNRADQNAYFSIIISLN